MASPLPELLHHLFEAQATRTPQEIALEAHGNIRWSYHDLNTTYNRLARYLSAHYRQGEIVALYLEKTDLLVVAVLAVLKARKAWIPLPLDAPPARLQEILTSCDVACVLSASEVEPDTFAGIPSTKVDEVLGSADIDAFPGDNLGDSSRGGRDLCHILFTSGSTGVPKGVMIEHGAVMHNVLALVERLGLQRDTRTLQFAAPVFDIFALNLFMTFACGGCLIVVRPSVIMEDMTNFVHESRITYTQLTSTVIRFMDPLKLPDLKIVVSSGEALPEGLGNQWRNQVRLVNAYGPTETIVCTIQELSGNGIDPACIGQALDGLDVLLLDEKMTAVVASGQTGKICVAGPQIFRGYCSTQPGHGRSDIDFRGRRYYRTGDLGRLEGFGTEHETIRYLGRRDNQVKVRGVRVDLGDVEQCIVRCPQVRNCVVVPLRGEGSEAHLSGVIVPETGSSLKSINEPCIEPRHSNSTASIHAFVASPRIRKFLKDAQDAAATNLPEHAIPSSWWLVDSLPLTESGKIDRMQIKDWLQGLDGEVYSQYQAELVAQSGDEGGKTKTGNVRLLQSLWAQVLGRPVGTINSATSFIALGANSLDIIRLVSEARKTGLDLTYAEVYTAKSIDNLVCRQKMPGSSQVEASESTYRPFSLLPQARSLAPILEEVAQICGIGVAEIDDVYPCTPYQSSLMLLDLRHPGSYLCIFDWTLPRDLDMKRLKAAWNMLIAGESVLRNRLVWDAGAQALWQVTVLHRDDRADWTQEAFNAPMTLGNDLCRAGIKWQEERGRWKFLLKIHHSIVDGWSLRLMLNRLKSTYHGEETGTHPSAMLFTRHVSHLLKRHREDDLAYRAFWQQNLEGFSPAEFPSPPSDPRHDVHATQHDSVLVAVNLRRVAAIHEVTPATILYGTAALVLGAHCRAQDLVFGLILAGRDTALGGILDMIGPAFTVVPFRSRIDRQATLKGHFAEIERRVMSIIRYQDYGLQQIKTCGAGASAACDFGCLVVVQPEDEILAGAGLWEEAHGQSAGLADNIPLSFELILAEENVLVKCNYDPALVSTDVVTAVLGHFKCILQDLSGKDGRGLVREINFDEQDEESRMLEWSREYGTPVNRCLHDIFLDAVHVHPDRAAIDDEGMQRQYTYRELDTLTSNLARWLNTTHGVRPGIIAPLSMTKSASAVVVILAILRAGAAYVPIDVDWPLERVAYILRETKASFILCSINEGGRYSGLAQTVIEVEPTSREDSAMQSLASSYTRSTDLAVVMYTSGSTGAPKGVMLEHGALSTSLTHLRRAFGLKPGMRHLQFSSFVYDVSLADIFIPLMTGACICMPTEDSRRNHLSATIRAMGIESAILTPSVVDLISPDDCESLDIIITGGEMPKRNMIRRWADLVQLRNAYGPTEASITTTVGSRQGADAEPSNIGQSITGWHWIVEQDGQGAMYPVPRGCVGEIAIAGHCLARGYLNNDALTADRFVVAPQLTKGLFQGRVYLTGDLGRYAADGTLRIIGRKDRVVKMNGIRIDPGEPESQLRMLGDIFVGCVVDCIEDEQGHPRVAAFVPMGAESDGEQSEGLIAANRSDPAFRRTCRRARQRLAEVLPRRSVPTLFIPVRQIPYTSSDKVDIRSLKDAVHHISNAPLLFGVDSATDDDVSGRAPATPAEIAVEAGFRRVFHHPHPLTTAVDFFLLGGDSFLAIKLVSAIRDHGFEVTVQDVYTNPNLVHLARAAQRVSITTPANIVSSVISDAVRAEVLDMSRVPRDWIEDIYPASPFQEGLAAITQQEHALPQRMTDLYSATIAFRLTPATDFARLDQALEWVVTQNPIWRTTFVQSSHGTMQLVRRPGIDGSTSAEMWPSLFRWSVEKTGNVLILRVQHALYDASTLRQLVEDVNHNYQHPDQMRPGRLPYRQFIDRLAKLDDEAARTFWGNQLREASLCRFPQLPRTSHQPRATSFTCSTSDLDLHDVRTLKLSPATVVAAAMALVLSAYCYSDDICYGITLSGRDEPDLENIAGPTLSTVPMRLQIRPDSSLQDLLSETQRLVLDMRRHQHFGLQNMASLPVRGIQNALRFRALLVMQHDSAEWASIRDDQPIGDMIPERTQMHVNYPLVLIAQMDNSAGRLCLRLEYDPKCVDDAQANRFVRHLQHVVHQCALPSVQLVDDIKLFTDADDMELAAWSTSQAVTHALPPLHDTFTRLAAVQPDSPAIDSCCQDAVYYDRLSYRELDRLATRLSEAISATVGNARFIGLCLPKSPVTVIAMLATWKAGLSFVPLDPSAPAQRLNGILDEFGPPIVVLTDATTAHLLASARVMIIDPSSSILQPRLQDAQPRTFNVSPEAISLASGTAYIMYTSGTSGHPKGVVVSQTAIAHSVRGYASSVNLQGDTRMLQFAAFTFDTSILEIFATLTTGGCLCIPSGAQRLAGGLAGAIRSMRVNWLLLTPTVAQLVPPEEVPGVECLMLVGEPPSPQLIQRWASRSPPVRVLNGYGPTEASVHVSTNCNLKPSEACNIGYASTGRMAITVPDQIRHLAAIGAIGELVVYGDAVADGYWNMPGLNAQAFGSQLPWLSMPTRFYRTGDLAHYASDGSVVYVGRKDHQVKLHGQRIEVHEIEWHIDQYGQFDECVVDVLPTDLLVAYLVPGSSPQKPFTKPLPAMSLPRDIVASLRSYLGSMLPSSMVPAIYVPIDAVPRTVSGKVDRHRLRGSMEEAGLHSYRLSGQELKGELLTKDQKILSSLWAQALSISEEEIGLHANISLLGGDSVTVIRVVAAARKCGLRLPTGKAYLHQTLESIAGAVIHDTSTTPKFCAAPLPFSLLHDGNMNEVIAMAAQSCNLSPDLVQDVYPCTDMQEDLMISSTLASGAYFSQETLIVAPSTSIPRLITSLQNVWKRNPILRTRIFLGADSRALQAVVNEEADVGISEEEDIQDFLCREANTCPTYGERLCRVTVVECRSKTFVVFARHHAVFDAWSQTLLLQHIEQEYNRRAASSSPGATFSAFVHHISSIRQLSTAAEFWQNHLTDASATILPQIGVSAAFEVNQRYTLEISQPSHCDYPLSTLAEAAWALLLAQYTQADDVSFGTIRSGRTCAVDGIETMMGPTLAAFPRRLMPVRTHSMNEFLADVQSRINQALPWEEYGRRRIRSLGPGPEQACRFRSLLITQMSPPPTAEQDLLVPWTSSPAEYTRGDCLMVECQPQENGLVISISYDDRLLAPGQVYWIAYHFSQTLAELTSRDNHTLDQLDMAGLKTIEQVRQFNQSKLEPCLEHVDDLFVQKSHQWRHARAIDASDAVLTYQELDLCSTRFAVILKKKGLGRGDIVPLLMTKGAAMVIAMLAVLKLRAAYAPISTDSPSNHVNLLLKRIRACQIIFTSDQEQLIDSLQTNSILCDASALLIGLSPGSDITLKAETTQPLLFEPGRNEHSGPGSNSELAYVLFTSGSTGTPKGVLIEHSALATTILENGRRMAYAPGTRTLSFAAYTFDVNIMEIYLTLLHGGSTRRTQSYMADKEIELAMMTPTAVRNLLREPAAIPSLKTLRVGGESLTKAIIQRWSSRVKLINSYGPTETCVDACRNVHVTRDTDPGSLGFPIGTHLWVVDPGQHSRLAPIGVPGELLISGPKLGRGYLDDEHATSKAFIDGSSFQWLPAPDHRLYATGDLVRQASDGSITYLGRKDLQMKVNGFRIECREVEAVIEGCEGVSAVVVEKVQAQRNGPEGLAAFFTLTQNGVPDGLTGLLPATDSIRCLIQKLRGRVENSLLPYMRPKTYLPLNSIPHNNSGKVDRGALNRILREVSVDQVFSYHSGSSKRRAPASDVQKILQALWAQVLSLNPSHIGLDSGFIALGGESLTAIELVRLCRIINLRVDVRSVLATSCLEDMAQSVEQEPEFSQASVDSDQKHQHYSRFDLEYDMVEILHIASACGLPSADVQDVYPATPTQEALIAVTVQLPEAYISRSRFRLPSSLDLNRFQAAWEIVERNNPILRTRICYMNAHRRAGLVQVICRSLEDWSEVTELDEKPMLVGLGRPLIRHRLLRMPNETLYELSRHHCVYNGISTGLIWEDLGYAYSHLASPPVRPAYRDYIHYLYAQDTHSDAAFWRDCLEGFRGEHYPPLPSAGYVCKATSDTSKTTVNNFEWNADCRFTFATIARAAWGLVLGMLDRRNASSKDICFASTSSGRTAPVKYLEQMTGPTITTVPIRAKFKMDQSIESYLTQVHDHTTAMLSHEHYGMHQIRKISPAAQAACSSTSLLVVQSFASEHQGELPLGLEREEGETETFTEPYGVVMECMQSTARNTTYLSASYDTELVTDVEITNLLHQTSWMIAELNRRCSEDVSIRKTLWGLAQDQIVQMQTWNPRLAIDPDKCLHHFFEDSTRLHPDRIAVVGYDGSLSYGELDCAANSLAWRLQDEYGIRPGSLVPLCFEKSSAMLVALLGILKAGAGYVPLDVSSPQTRLDHMIQVTDACVVIVSSLQARDKVFEVPLLVLDKLLSSTPTRNIRPCTAHVRDIAYVTFTSGTTGRPKGVMTEHGSASLSVVEHCKRYRHDHHGNALRTLQYSSYTFDASVLDIFATFAQGGCLYLPSEDERLGDLQSFLIEKHITFADLTPTIASLLDLRKLPELKVLAIGGEMATCALIEKLTASNSPLEYIVNSYGPSEAAIGCAAGEITRESIPGSVGKRVGGSLWIVDETNCNHLLPVSCRGELVITGPTLARGYLHADKITKEAFIECAPWLTMVGETRFYKTGDLACIDINGSVTIIGRKDDEQIKLHGIRVELGEIEAALRSCPCLASVRHISAAMIDVSGKAIIVAFIHHVGGDCDADQTVLGPPNQNFLEISEEARRGICQAIPEHMTPRLWLPVSTWPLTESGKTDRRRLVAACTALDSRTVMNYQRPYTSAKGIMATSARTAAEELLADAWRKVLHQSPDVLIDPGDDFFNIGGDSLGVIMLVAQLRQQGLSMTAHQIFTTRRLRAMAALLENLMPSDLSSSSASLDDSGWVKLEDIRHESTPATSITDQIVHTQASKRTDQAHPQRTEILAKELETPTLDMKTDQCDSSSSPLLPRQSDIEALYPASPIQLAFLVEGQKWCRAYYAWSFLHLDRSVSIAQARSICADYDGFCLSNILNAFSQASSGLLYQQSPMVDYQQFMNHVVATSNGAADRFWAQLLHGSCPTSIVRSVDPRKRPVMNCNIKKTVTFAVQSKERISYVTLLKATWALALHQLSHSDDITFGNIVSGRLAAFDGIQDVIGPCLNAVPLRVGIDRKSSIRELLQRIDDQHIAAIPYELVSMDRIAKQADWPCRRGPWTLFQYQNLPDQVRSESGGNIDNKDTTSASWGYAGNATYGGGLLQAGMCWLMAWPVQNSQASFRFTYSPLTLPTAAAKHVMRVFLETLREINQCDISSPLSSIVKNQEDCDIFQHLFDDKDDVQANDDGGPHSTPPLDIDTVPTTILRHLKAIWDRVLDLPIDESTAQADVPDPEISFFDLGGDSISATELAFASSKAGLDLTLQDVIDFPTMAQQGALLAGIIERPVRDKVKLVFQEDHQWH
ncbi:MAG: hypothetical protein Q9220_007606 [cf. Caloplaca sp. 1 TL-2023]